jgi:AcrR family transcriptional regulator
MATRLRREEQVERNRGLVLDAARRVFLAKGYGGATLEAIADEAGFSKGVVYSQFASKADLFLALLERRIDERADANDRIGDRFRGADGVVELLRAAEQDHQAETAWAAVLLEFRSLALHDQELNRRYAALHERTVGRLAAVLERFHAEGAAAAFPPRVMAEFILALGSGLTLERAVNPDALPRHVVLDVVRRAFAPNGSTR